ncbi:oligosaccharide flippase family protein [Candidatus Gottesmanbacteria bacterium]|nr:oligosaccharide flippase family protein [Candidatus Gottesmanbacteria bacterium]
MFKNKLVRGSLLVLGGNLLSGIFNYLYHPLVGRFLDPASYGLIESLVVLSYFLGIFSGALSLSIVHFAAKINEVFLPGLISRLEKISAAFSVITWLLFLLTFPVLNNFLHIGNFWFYFIFSLPILFSFLHTVYSSLLQARLKLLALVATGFSSSLGKFLGAAVCLLIGAKIAGALWALVAASVIPTVFGWYLVRKYWPKNKAKTFPNLDKNFWRFSFLSLVTNFSLISLYSSDVLLVRYFLPEQSGLYAVASILGKIIFFVAGSVLTVSFPLFNYKNNNYQSLWWSFLLITMISLFGFLGASFWAGTIVKITYGSTYLAAANFLPGFTIFMTLLAIFNLFIQFLLSKQNYFAGVIPLIIAFTQIFLIIFNHNSLGVIIRSSSLVVTLGIFFSLLCFYPSSFPLGVRKKLLPGI